MKINYNWNENQLEILEETRKLARDLHTNLEHISWIFEQGSEEDRYLYELSHKAEIIECEIEKQLPF